MAIDLYEIRFDELMQTGNVDIGEPQNTFSVIKFDNLGFDELKSGATGVVTSTKTPGMDTLENPTTLFKDGHTGPDLGSASSSDIYNWLSNLPDIGQGYSGVSGTAINTQIAFTPGYTGTESYMVVNTAMMNNGGTYTGYNNSVGIAFDESIVNGSNGSVVVYPISVVLNCLGNQYVALVGSPVSPSGC